MISCPMSTALSRHVSSPYYTEHGQCCGAVLSDRITTVAISRSGQLGLCCTVESNCSDLSARLAAASVTRDRDLDTCELSCVPGATSPFFIPVVTACWGLGGTWQHRSPPLKETEPRVMGHVAAPEPTSTGRRDPELRNMWQRQSSTR
jgi:hypothetical protein